MKPRALAEARHPWERPVFALSVLANAALVALALVLVDIAPEWISGRPAVSRVVKDVQAAVYATILLIPVLGFVRAGRWAKYRESAVRIGRDQVPELYAILERLCARLGVDPPELYGCALKTVDLSTSLCRPGRVPVIVLGPHLFRGLRAIRDREDVFEFILAHELARIELRHAGGMEEVLLGYLKRIPLLRITLLRVQTASRDRFAATLCGGRGIRGLVFTAAGGKLFDQVDVAAYVRQVMANDTPWFAAWLGSLKGEIPHAGQRVRELYRDGFLDLERDLASPRAGGPR